jgi:conjugal transfer ATP-binding protein TraC
MSGSCELEKLNRLLGNFESVKISQAVKKVYMVKKNNACFDDVYNELINDDEIRIRDLGVQLYPYSLQGEYSKYFNGKANVEFNNQFIVLELEELNMKKNLRGVILNLLMMRVSQDMYLSPKNQMKICGIDEGWDLMRGGSATQEFMETGYRRARKYNGSFITITQRIQDYYANEGAQACLTNSDSVFMLKQKPESVDQLKEDKKLSLSNFGLELVKSIHTRKGIYSEIYIKSNGVETPVRLMVDPYSSLVYTTDPKDFQMVEDYKAMGYPTHEAIEKVLEIKRRLAA